MKYLFFLPIISLIAFVYYKAWKNRNDEYNDWLVPALGITIILTLISALIGVVLLLSQANL